jgi:hypothetical protein|eukprot:TRINITY_DN46166_c0_g1_i1.p1 TRINITY_DN46166_c0_g1~~TRINITY_DN46166_c0_g1_i1.p1  ORF type:complete len:348 (-),score=62.62 TRINITY_DN46166_c0_g1_i1:59-1063(-)
MAVQTIPMSAQIKGSSDVDSDTIDEQHSPKKVPAKVHLSRSEAEALLEENLRLAEENRKLRMESKTLMDRAGVSGEIQDQWWTVQPGATVIFQGLKQDVSLNGMYGFVERWHAESGRWVVRLQSGEEKVTRTECLQVVHPPFPVDCKASATSFKSNMTASTACPEELSEEAIEQADSTCGSFTVPQYQQYQATTVMMRNIPNSYTRDMLLQLLDDEGFLGCYDMVYLPIDFQSKVGLGYAFINMVTMEDAFRFQWHFSGFSSWTLASDKVCQITWGDTLQGLHANIERYRNSPVMHASVPDEFRPVLFKDGVRVPFPAPTRSIREPRMRRLWMP